MAVPKRKISRARRDKRKAQHRLTPYAIAFCPQCHEPKLPHRACMNCGSYKGRMVLPTEEV